MRRKASAEEVELETGTLAAMSQQMAEAYAVMIPEKMPLGANRVSEPVASGSPDPMDWDAHFDTGFDAVSDPVAMDDVPPDICWETEVQCRDADCGGLCRITEGFYVCMECGTLGDACIETGAEWRSFGNEDSKVADPSRCGGTTTSYLLPEQSCGSMISPKWRESEAMRSARQYHRWNSSHSRGRTLLVIFGELQRVAYKNGFPRMIVEDTKHLYKTTTEYHMFRGDNRVGLYAYCLFHTCKRHNVPRSIKEICKMFGVNEQTLTKGHSAFIKVIKEYETLVHRRHKGAEVGVGGTSADSVPVVGADSTTAIPTQTPGKPPLAPTKTRKRRTHRKCDDGSKLEMLAKPSDYIDRFCSRMGLSEDVCAAVHQMVGLIQQHQLSTDNPALVTAATIHIVLKSRGTASATSEIQKVSNISHVTIDKCYKKLMAFEAVLVA